jgi:hypothetical protein
MEVKIFSGFTDDVAAIQYRDRINAVLARSPIASHIGRMEVRLWRENEPQFGYELWMIDHQAATVDHIRTGLIYELCQAIGLERLVYVDTAQELEA